MSETEYKNYLMKQQQMQQEEDAPVEEDNMLEEQSTINFKEETKEEAIQEIKEESQLVELNDAPPAVPTNSTKKPELSEKKQEESKIISIEEDVKNQQMASKKALEKASNEEAKAKAMREKAEKDKKDIESK